MLDIFTSGVYVVISFWSFMSKENKESVGMDSISTQRLKWITQRPF